MVKSNNIINNWYGADFELYQLSWLLLLQDEKDTIKQAPRNGNVHVLQEMTSSGVNITGSLDWVSMRVAIQVE